MSTGPAGTCGAAEVGTDVVAPLWLQGLDDEHTQAMLGEGASADAGPLRGADLGGLSGGS